MEEAAASVLERDHVHSVYEKIAPYFSDARYTAWPKVQQFLLAQETGSLVADIGCGNGKYLHLNSQAYKVGCDYCFPLAESARNRGYEIMVCDGLCLPYRSQCFDAVISIAVIHHFSTKERRIRAIKEMARVLRAGGQIMIYVWAMEQKRRKFEKQDIFVPWDTPSPETPSPDPPSHTLTKSKHQHHSNNHALQHRRSLEGTEEELKKSTSFLRDMKASYTSLEKTSSWSSFSKSLDSVLDFSDWSSSIQQATSEQRLFHDFRVHLDRAKPFEQSKSKDLTKGTPVLFTRSRQGVEDDEWSVNGSLLQHHGSDFHNVCPDKSCKHTPSGELMNDCSRVSLPDLVCHHKEVPLSKHLKSSSAIEEVDSHKHLNKTKSKVPLCEAGGDGEMVVSQNLEQTSPEGACLRYYHVFKKGELVELIERYIPELHIVQAYFDHANWCVIAEKVNVWKI